MNLSGALAVWLSCLCMITTAADGLLLKTKVLNIPSWEKWNEVTSIGWNVLQIWNFDTAEHILISLLLYFMDHDHKIFLSEFFWGYIYITLCRNGSISPSKGEFCTEEANHSHGHAFTSQWSSWLEPPAVVGCAFFLAWMNLRTLLNQIKELSSILCQWPTTCFQKFISRVWM